ncbi:MAG: arylsulfatase [Bacteroidota bacterium]
MKTIYCNYPLLLLAVLFFHINMATAQNQKDNRPNFIVIVADDMGFSDVGCFGGEINTPNIDQLAQEGVRYPNFYVAPTCSPTRSMLLTGIDNHLVGLGSMYEKRAPNHDNLPGYEGVLSTEVPVLPEILQENGYHTYMAGKWHLGKEREYLPRARGFERSFSMLSGGGCYFSMSGADEWVTPNNFSEDGEYLDKLPEDFYATKTYTDKIIEYIESNKGDGKPFFAYLAHQAPHEPLSVPNKYLRKYKGKFDEGWDKLREERLQRMQEMGIMPEGVDLGERFWYIPEFEDLRVLVQYSAARKMEVYAAVVDYLDMEVGRLLKYLEDNNLRENTYIIFFSDNGPETFDKANAYKNQSATLNASWMATEYTHGFQNWGRKDSWTAYGPSWAQVSATPFYAAKATTYEGGIRSPLVVVPPSRTNAGQVNNDALMHIKDVAPTLLDLAGIEQPTSQSGETPIDMQGKSWTATIKGEASSPRTDEEYVGIEFFGGSAIRKGDWKIVRVSEPIGSGDWELYNLQTDPGERHNLAASNPEKLQELLNHWSAFKTENNVVLPNRSVFDGMDERLPPRPPVYAPGYNQGSETLEEK